MERAGEICDEAQNRLAYVTFPFFLMSQKPAAIVVAFEAREKTKEFGSEISRHRNQGKKPRRKSKGRVHEMRH